MFARIVKFFATGPDKLPRLENPEAKALYERKRTSVYFSLVFGYAFFYTTRLSLSVAKKGMADAGVVTIGELGIIGATLFYIYAVGKFVNGALADSANIRRFMSTALLLSASVNLAFGASSSFGVMVVLWAFNGWFQSVGSAPCVVSLCQWFSQRERGTRYGIWAGAHNIGEGLTFLCTAGLISLWGWRWGFFGPGLACVVVAMVLFKTLADRPQTYGLPPVAEYKEDMAAIKKTNESLGQLRNLVFKSPVMWVLGMSSGLMYVTRYAVHSWGPLYLEAGKGYSLLEAGALIGFATPMGLVGAACSGLISDRVFGSRRNIPTLLYGLLLTGSLLALYLVPPGNTALDTAALVCFEFAIGGLIVFLAGLIAVDIMPTRAAGTVKGMLGLFSYLGAATQEWVSGLLIEAGKTGEGAEAIYNFDAVFLFWIGASVGSLLLALTVWNAKPRE